MKEQRAVPHASCFKFYLEFLLWHPSIFEYLFVINQSFLLKTLSIKGQFRLKDLVECQLKFLVNNPNLGNIFFYILIINTLYWSISWFMFSPHFFFTQIVIKLQFPILITHSTGNSLYILFIGKCAICI